MRSIFFTEASLAEDYRMQKTDFPTQSQGNLHALGRDEEKPQNQKDFFQNARAPDDSRRPLPG